MVKRFFTEDEANRIAEAIRNAESRTSGEIVPMMVAQSSSYSYDTHLRMGAFLAMISTFVLFVLDASNYLMFFALVMSFVIGNSLNNINWLRRFFVSQERMTHRVEAKAREAFLMHNLHLTKNHTGVLIFASIFERKVVVIADKGINDKFKAWNEVVNLVLEGMKSGKPASGFEKAINRCGDILGEHFPKEADDTNELSDTVIEEGGA